jgi:hypothetical protein
VRPVAVVGDRCRCCCCCCCCCRCRWHNDCCKPARAGCSERLDAVTARSLMAWTRRGATSLGSDPCCWGNGSDFVGVGGYDAVVQVVARSRRVSVRCAAPILSR